jgi:hypothetical protein
MVLDALKEKGPTIPFVMYDLRHTFATRAAQNGMPLPTLASVLGHSSLRQVQKYVHPTHDHQAAEMDRIDKIGQDRKRQYAEFVRSQAHNGPAATGNSEDFERSGGKRCNDDTSAHVIRFYSQVQAILRVKEENAGGAGGNRTPE